MRHSSRVAVAVNMAISFPFEILTEIVKISIRINLIRISGCSNM